MHNVLDSDVTEAAVVYKARDTQSLRKVNIIFVMSVQVRMEHLASHWTDFH
jgi:hypothetical protein